VLEEMPNGVPYVFEAADGKTGRGLSLIRQSLEQGAAFAVEAALRSRRDFKVARVVGERGDLPQLGAGVGMVARGIVAVRCIEEIYVVAAGIEAGTDDFAHLLQSG